MSSVFGIALFVWMDAARKAEMAQRKSALSDVPADSVPGAGVPAHGIRHPPFAPAATSGGGLRAAARGGAWPCAGKQKKLATGGNRRFFPENHPTQKQFSLNCAVPKKQIPAISNAYAPFMKIPHTLILVSLIVV